MTQHIHHPQSQSQRATRSQSDTTSTRHQPTRSSRQPTTPQQVNIISSPNPISPTNTTLKRAQPPHTEGIDMTTTGTQSPTWTINTIAKNSLKRLAQECMIRDIRFSGQLYEDTTTIARHTATTQTQAINTRLSQLQQRTQTRNSSLEDWLTSLQHHHQQQPRFHQTCEQIELANTLICTAIQHKRNIMAGTHRLVTQYRHQQLHNADNNLQEELTHRWQEKRESQERTAAKIQTYQLYLRTCEKRMSEQNHTLTQVELQIQELRETIRKQDQQQQYAYQQDHPHSTQHQRHQTPLMAIYAIQTGKATTTTMTPSQQTCFHCGEKGHYMPCCPSVAEMAVTRTTAIAYQNLMEGHQRPHSINDPNSFLPTPTNDEELIMKLTNIILHLQEVLTAGDRWVTLCLHCGQFAHHSNTCQADIAGHELFLPLGERNHTNHEALSSTVMAQTLMHTMHKTLDDLIQRWPMTTHWEKEQKTTRCNYCGNHGHQTGPMCTTLIRELKETRPPQRPTSPWAGQKQQPTTITLTVPLN
jgi:hypothetical protein